MFLYVAHVLLAAEKEGGRTRTRRSGGGARGSGGVEGSVACPLSTVFQPARRAPVWR